MTEACQRQARLPRKTNEALEPLPGRRSARLPAQGLKLVPGEGVEPSWAFARRILSAVRIPFRHPGPWNDAALRLPRIPIIGRNCR